MSNVYSNVVETMIRRHDPLKNHAPAPTIFNLDKIQYVFQPRPELTGDTEASVCIVISQEHREYLLNDSRCKDNFRAYVPKEVAPEEVQERALFEAFKELRKTMTAEEILELTAPKPTTTEPTLEEVTQTGTTTASTAVKGIDGAKGIGGPKPAAAKKTPAPASDFAPPEQGGSGKLDLAEEF